MGKKFFSLNIYIVKERETKVAPFTISYTVISIQRSIAEFSANPSSLSKQASEAREPFVD